MQLFYRLLFTSFLVICFLITAPALVLYTSGYRFDFTSFRIIETGLLSIQSYPKSADIYIDDQSVGKKTPNKLTSLLPKTYTLTIKKEGYFDWKKQLPVYPGKATIAEYLTLFLKNQTPAPLLQGSQEILFQNGYFILFLEQKNKQFLLQQYDILTQQITALQTLTDRPQVRISDDGSTVVTENKGKIQLFLRDAPENMINLSQEFSSPKTKLKISDIYFYNTKTIYVLFNGLMYSYDLRYGNTQKLTEHIDNSYIAHDKSILYISSGDQESYIMKKELKPQSIPIILARIPKTNEVSWGESSQDTAILLDKQHDILYVVDVRSNQIRPIFDIFFGATQGTWDTQSQRLLYASTYEVWMWNKNTESRNFIYRFEEPIQNITWIPGTSYVVVATSSTLWIVETETTNGVNVYPVSSLSGITKVSVTPDGKNIVYRIQKKTTQTTWILPIQL